LVRPAACRQLLELRQVLDAIVPMHPMLKFLLWGNHLALVYTLQFAL
jgi:hypothetical protein